MITKLRGWVCPVTRRVEHSRWPVHHPISNVIDYLIKVASKFKLALQILEKEICIELNKSKQVIQPGARKAQGSKMRSWKPGKGIFPKLCTAKCE